MTAQDKKTPEWLVERLALGELDATAAADVRRRLATEGRDVEAELAAIATSNREILDALPPAMVAGTVRRRAEARPARRASWMLALPLAVGGVAALLLVARPGTHVTTGGGQVLEDTNIKGPAALKVYRQVGTSNEKLYDGASATRGDLLQLAYRAGDKAMFGALLSIDGRGHVTVHWPEGNAESAARLSQKGEIKLPSAYELDDAPAYERFVFVTSEAPFSMSSVLEAAHALAARPSDARVQRLALPASLNQLSLTLDKTTTKEPTP
jgi:hypothetical protein